MSKQGILNLKSLKEHVYEYLREQLQRGEIKPGTVINMEETSLKLGVSRTPLRDALFQLESEDFVTILPRRGVVVNQLTLQDIKNYYEIIGSLESMAVLLACPSINDTDVKKLRGLTEKMDEAIHRNNFNSYYQNNLKFHNIFLNACGNRHLLKIVNNLKKRLYDFPRQEGFVKEWEVDSIKEHQDFVDLIAQRKHEEAARFMRDVHWSFCVQEKYIKKYYQHAVALSEDG
ncbi:GntR family transcriptional regulator [Acidobacteriota bacterium]